MPKLRLEGMRSYNENYTSRFQSLLSPVMRLNSASWLLLAAMALPAASVQAQKKSAKPKAAQAAPAQKAAPAPVAAPAPAPDPVILSVGTAQVPKSEFLYVYKKNNANAPEAFTSKSLREYLDLFTKFKLKVLDAQAAGLDTAGTFKRELDGYRKQLAQPYLTEKKVTESLIKEAYDRMGEELDVSHILITVGPDADPKDTTQAFVKAMAIRNRVAKGGESFEAVAAVESQDPSAKQNKGRLGYFTALQMVYPFEDMAYKTPKGQISQPVRTRFGYHLIKVHERRKSQGQVKVAHIMVKAQPGISAEDSIAAKKKIDELYAKLLKGEKFETLAKEFSDDEGSKDKGGELPLFGTGQMIPEFEDASFKLEKANDLSKPFKTAYGWHIVRMIERKPLDKFTEMEGNLKQRVSKDSRSELNQTVFLDRIKRENKLVEYPAVMKQVAALGDTALINARYKYNADNKLNSQTLFKIGDKAYTVGSFLQFVENTQMPRTNKEGAYVMRLYYQDYLKRELVAFEDSQLETKYEDFRLLMKEYREGIMLFQQMDNKVWSKALEDTAGLRAFYNKNSDKYRWGQRVKATIYNCSDAAALAKVKAMLKAKSFAITDPKFLPVTFEKNDAKLAPINGSNLWTAIETLKRDKTLSVEVIGYADKDEKGSIAKERVKRVVDTLVARGVEPARIKSKDGGKSATAAKENQRVEFAVFGSSPKQMEAVLNLAAPLTLETKEGYFEKGNDANIDAVPWQVGEHQLNTKERVKLIIISAVEAPRSKYLDETRGVAISDYQTYLEEAWITSLKAKYPVSINEAEVEKLVKK